MGFSSFISIVSCEDYLDQLPDNRIELSSESDINDLLTSAYPDCYPAFMLETASDNADENINNSWTEANILQRQAYKWQDITDTSTDTPRELWSSCYSAISTANEAIQFIEQSGANMEKQLGEALLCRAYSAFIMSNVFCKAYNPINSETDLGLPYPEKPQKFVGEKYERGTLSELYKKIDRDIQRALPLVGDNYKAPKFHFTKTAAYAFAARFYLYYGKPDLTIKYASFIFGTNPCTMLRDWASWDALSKNRNICPDAYVNSNINANIMLLMSASEWSVVAGPYLFGDRYCINSLIANKEVQAANGPWGDGRNLYYGSFSNSSLSKYIVRKLGYYFDEESNGIGYPYTEYSVFNGEETLLCRAEAYIRIGKYKEALYDINYILSVFTRNGVQLTFEDIAEFYSSIEYYTPLKPTPKKKINPYFEIDTEKAEPMLQCLLQLRRVLTVHEGLRWQDINRYGIVIYRRRINANGSITAITDTLQLDDQRRAIQLPSDVISAGITPNPR